MDIGDYKKGTVIYVKFNSGGALAGDPAFACYKDNSATEITAGITPTLDFDDRPDFHHLSIDTSNAAYTAGMYAIVCTAGTVAGVSAVGRIVRTFSIEYRGEVKIDKVYEWDNQDASTQDVSIKTKV